jgi:hypothetical protein
MPVDVVALGAVIWYAMTRVELDLAGDLDVGQQFLLGQNGPCT